MNINNIDHKLLEDLSNKIEEDGIQKIVVGAVVFFHYEDAKNYFPLFLAL